MPEDKKTKRPETVAEQDARVMLMAGGLSPADGQSALQRLIGDLPHARMLITFEEFRSMAAMSKATFHRLLRAGRGPRVVTLMGTVKRIHIDDATQWISSRQDAAPEPEHEVTLPERKPRAVKPKAPAETVRRLFEAPPKKRGSARGPPTAVDGSETEP